MSEIADSQLLTFGGDRCASDIDSRSTRHDRVPLRPLRPRPCSARAGRAGRVAAEVIETVSGIPDTQMPANEAQANELAPLRTEPELNAHPLWQSLIYEALIRWIVWMLPFAVTAILVSVYNR